MKTLTMLDEAIKYLDATNFGLIEYEDHNREYEGFKTTLDNQTTIRSRLAKKTPKKKGYFVAVYKKESNNINKPYSYFYFPDYLLVHVIDGYLKGVFIFTKDILIKKGIVSSSDHKGKMAFRVYTPWDTDLNATAAKTYAWQKDYFIDLTNNM
ncbi:MAG: MepB family protein [Erysipelotrichales bacterium]